jgi:hypothetical protein
MMAARKQAASVRFKQAAGIQAREVENELFIAAPDSGTIHHLNRTASAVWRALVEPRSAEDVIALFQAAFPDLPKRKIAKDVTDVLAFLTASKLLVRAEIGRAPQKRRSPAR